MLLEPRPRALQHHAHHVDDIVPDEHAVEPEPARGSKERLGVLVRDAMTGKVRAEIARQGGRRVAEAGVREERVKTRDVRHEAFAVARSQMALIFATSSRRTSSEGIAW